MLGKPVNPDNPPLTTLVKMRQAPLQQPVVEPYETIPDVLSVDRVIFLKVSRTINS